MKKLLKAVFASLILALCSNVYAKDFDWSQCWCNYGAGMKSGDVLVDIDAGFSSYFLTTIALGDGYWSIPYTEVSVDVIVPIWKLPFSFGGYAGFNMNGYNGKNGDESYTNASLSIGGEIKYHIMMPVEILDLYAGIKTGANIPFGGHAGDITVYSPFDFEGILGANFMFTKNTGLNVEFGVPVWLKAGVAIKF